MDLVIIQTFIASSPPTGINFIGSYTFNVGVTTISYTVRDAAGNQTGCSFTVTITDNQNPTIICPANINTGNTPGNCNATVAIPNPVTADNCGATVLLWTMTGATSASSPPTGINFIGSYVFNAGITAISYTVRDAAGNLASCIFTVTVTDNQNPTIICPANINAGNTPGNCNATVAVPNPVTADNCGVTIVSWTMTGATTASSPATGINFIGSHVFNVGNTTIFYTVKDAAGNLASCSFSVNISDTELPTVICPSNITNINSPGNCSATVAVPNPVTGDNCGVTLLSWTMTGATSASSPTTAINYVGTYTFNVGITTVAYTVKDASGNQAACSFTVIISDTQSSIITCPANMIANNTPGTCHATVVIPNPATADNCGVTILTWTMTGATSASSPPTGINQVGSYIFNVGTTVISYTVKDAAGNQAACSLTVKVNDDQPPQLHGIPANTTIVCVVVPPPPPIGAIIYATDNCDPAVVVIFSETSTQRFDNSCASVIYQITRKWVATDNSGNQDSAFQLINVLCECCINGIDDDGNGLIDEEDPKCPCSAPEYRQDCNSNLIYLVPPIWQMDPNYNGDPNLYTNPSSLVISSPFGTAHINVRTGDGTTFNQNYTVVQGTPLTITLNYNLVQTPQYNVAESSRGLVVETDQLLQVLYRLTANNNQILITIQGEQAYGMRFRAGSQTNVCGLPNTQKRENHFISVMALENNTQVSFEFSTKMKGLPFNHTVTLNAFQSYVAIDNDSNKTITGSLITASKDIAVISGSQHSQQCAGGNGRDGAADQLVPSCVAGIDYIVFRGIDDNNPSTANYAVITAIAAGTQVFVDGGGAAVATLLPGQYYTYNIPGPDFSNHYIHTSKPAYCYQFGSVQDNGEIGMASVPPIHGCNGDKYIEFFKFPNATINNLTIVIPLTGLGSLTLNGNPYMNYTTAKTIPGFPNWRTVTFSNANLNNFNIVRSNESFHAAQFIGKTDAGAFGYLTSFKDKIAISNPVTGQPSVEYFVDTVCGGQHLNHCITANSCSGGLYISNVIQSPNTGGIEIFPNSNCFNYIGKTGYSGMDSITVMMSDQLGFTQPVCLTFFVCGSPPLFNTIPDSIHWCVQDIDTATWNGAGDFTPNRPDWYTFHSGDTSLDLNPATFTDDCTAPLKLIIHWKITLLGGTTITGTGQVSAFGSDMQFPLGDNTITYWLEDECGSLTPPGSRPVVIIRVLARPDVMRNF